MLRLRSLSLVVPLVAGCAQKPVPEFRSSAGSLAISADDKLAFAADADNGALEIVDLALRERVATVKVGALPQAVAVGQRGEVYVSNRGSRTVSVVTHTDLGWQVAGEARVGAEPTGIAVSPDGERLAVANTTSGTVTLVDTRALSAVGEVEVGGAPRAVAFRPGGSEVYVTDYEGGLKIVRVGDLTVTRTVSLKLAMKDQRTLGMGMFAPTGPRSPSHATALALSPDGRRAYVAHAQCRDQTTATAPDGSAPAFQAEAPADYYGPSGGVPVVAAAITTVDVEREAPALEDPDADERLDFPPPLLLAGKGRSVLSMPSAAVTDPSGRWLFVANLSSNNVAVLSTVRELDEEFEDPDAGLLGVVGVGAAPTGIAIPSHGAFALVHNSFDHSLSVVQQVADAAGTRMAETQRIALGESPLTPAQQRGRALFFSAVDPRMASPETGVSCVSCHGDGGRTDGRTWTFSEGPRNTPTLAFHEISSTAPFHWDGKLLDLAAFQKIIQERMGGTGLSPQDFQDLAEYLAVIPEPDNPHRGSALTAEQALGKEIFEDPARGNCASCHAGPAYTDNQLKDTARPFGADNRIATPPLRGLFATAPYRHDGSAATLREVVTTPGTIAAMDMRGKLSGGEIDALVAYLLTL